MSQQSGYLTGSTLGRFRIGPLLGRGGMGEVYRAEDAELGRSIALKVLPESLLGDEDRLARFIQEARTASALNHPHIVAIYDIGRQTPGGHGASAEHPVQYVAMELVTGVTLRDRIDRRGLDLKHTLDYLGQAAEALAAAHAAGIVHRDLKPENLMVADGGYVKVLDFGLAKLRADGAATATGGAVQTMTAGTSPGVVLGTVGYMSPEQAQGRPVDARSDIFSFGCILYEAVTGTRAFSGDSAVDTLHRIIHDQPQPVAARLPSAPAELQRIIRKCLAKDPEERYQSMKELAIDLRDLRKQVESGAVAIAAPAPPAARQSRAPVLVFSAAIAAALAVVAIAAWALNHVGSAPDKVLAIARLTSSGNVIDATISPDGKYFAYVESAGGNQTLWYKQINGSRALELVPAGHVGFWGINFSKDGTSIYYALKSNVETLGTLFEIPVLGGTPRRVLTGIDSSASFSPDGSRVTYLRGGFPNTSLSAVMIANADGSDAHALATVQAPDLFSPGFFAAASWSPDGRRIAATVRNSQTRAARLVVIDAATGAVSDLPGRYAAATYTEWVPDGTGIVFVGTPLDGGVPGAGGQLMLQPYPSGPLRHVTNDLVDYRVAHITADGRSMLTVAFDATVGVWTAPYDDPGAIQKIPSLLSDGRFGLAWSGDAQRILVGGVARDRRQIWSIAKDGSDRREFAVAGQALWPCPAPDGSFVAFLGSLGGPFAIWRARLDGAEPRQLASVSDPAYLTISPDGRWLYYSSSASGTSSTWRVPTDGSAPPALVVTGLERAALSPDGSLLAGLYVSGPAAPLTLAVVPATGGAPMHQFGPFTQATGSGSIVWAPDAKSVLYTNTERINIWRQSLAGGSPEKITTYQDLMIFRFTISRDGKQLAVARGTQTRDAVLIGNFR